MKNFIISLVTSLLVSVIVVVLVGGNQSEPLKVGAEGDTNYTNLVLSGDLTVDDDVTVSGRSLAVTTSNTSTSSASVGCVQTTATSTATPVKFTLTDTSTTTKAGPNGTSANGFVLWSYGTCP